jgi:hypothetical protein
MNVTVVVRGFKVTVAVLGRFLRANGVWETEGYAPFYNSADGELDNPSKLMRAKMGGSNTRLFIPNRMAFRRSTFAYVAYAWVFVLSQRKLNLLDELPDAAPEGFAELRDEIMGFATAEETSDGMDQDLTDIFVVITDDQGVSLREPFISRQVGSGP